MAAMTEPLRLSGIVSWSSRTYRNRHDGWSAYQRRSTRHRLRAFQPASQPTPSECSADRL